MKKQMSKRELEQITKGLVSNVANTQLLIEILELISKEYEIK